MSQLKMISTIYNTNKILFKKGKRKGHSKDVIQTEVNKSISTKVVKPLKKKKKKPKTFNEDMLLMYEKRREKRRNEYKPK
jgi:hypothetical protein